MPEKEDPRLFFTRNAEALCRQYSDFSEERLMGALLSIIRIQGELGISHPAILDIGCGTGELSCVLTKYFKECVTAVSPFEDEIKIARETHGDSLARFHVSGFCTLSRTFPNKKFDLIYSNNAMQYLILPAEREEALRDMAAVTHPQGRVIIRYPVAPTRTNVHSCHPTVSEFAASLESAFAGSANRLVIAEANSATANFTPAGRVGHEAEDARKKPDYLHNTREFVLKFG